MQGNIDIHPFERVRMVAVARSQDRPESKQESYARICPKTGGQIKWFHYRLHAFIQRHDVYVWDRHRLTSINGRRGGNFNATFIYILYEIVLLHYINNIDVWQCNRHVLDDSAIVIEMNKKIHWKHKHRMKIKCQQPNQIEREREGDPRCPSEQDTRGRWSLLWWLFCRLLYEIIIICTVHTHRNYIKIIIGIIGIIGPALFSIQDVHQ